MTQLPHVLKRIRPGSNRHGYGFVAPHAFHNGEYVSIRGEDGEMHTFRVASVEPAT